MGYTWWGSGRPRIPTTSISPALRKLAADYELHDRAAALGFLQQHAAKGQIVTGLLYVEKDSEDLHAHLRTVDAPLNTLNEAELCPGQATLEAFNASLR